jgi:glucose-6-phosphate 1-dehydrogenase
MELGTPPEPSLIVIFGAGGDLARRELIPALYQLFRDDLLPDAFAVIGFSRGAQTDDQFRNAMKEAFGAKPPDPEVWGAFSKILYFTPGDFGDPGAYQTLATRISEVRAAHAIPDNVFFHLAAPPDFFAVIADQLAAVGLDHGEAWRRIVIEKTF